ncbi:MAG: translation initiation factor eIF-2B [Nitrospinota bacterium]
MEIRPPWLRRLAGDRTQGATALARLAAECLTSSLPKLSGDTLESFLAALLHLTLEMRKSQPAMAPLFHLANDALRAAENAKTRGTAPIRVRAAVRRFLVRQGALAAQAVRQALPLIPPGATVLTHSASSLVETVLQRAAGKRRGMRSSSRIRVICTESRPAGEGSRLALRLARAQIPTTLLIDAAAGEALAEADLFLVGADSVTPKGLIHKVGTNALAGLARGRGIPCYAVATSQKLLPERYLLPTWNEAREASEVLGSSVPDLRVLNRPFDRTPWRRLSAVITEEGPLSKADVSRKLRELRPALGWG